MLNVICETTTNPDFCGIKADVFQTHLQFKFHTCLQNAFFTFKMQSFVLSAIYLFLSLFYALVKI